MAAHGGKLVALGRFREAQKGDIAPRQVLNLVEWESRDAFQHCLDDPWGFEPPSGAIAILDEGNMGVRPRVRVVEIAGDFRIYGSGVANGIQEAGGKIPIRSTRKTKGFRRDPEALFKFMSRIVL